MRMEARIGMTGERPQRCLPALDRGEPQIPAKLPIAPVVQHGREDLRIEPQHRRTIDRKHLNRPRPKPFPSNLPSPTSDERILHQMKSGANASVRSTSEAERRSRRVAPILGSIEEMSL